MLRAKKNKADIITHQLSRRPNRFLNKLNIGSQGQEVIDSLSMLLLSGIDVVTALDALRKDVRSKRLGRLLDNVRADIDAGIPIWQAMEHIALFPPYVISLLQLGEMAGRLPQNLQAIVVQQEKDKAFTSKVRSATLYPVITLGLTVMVGIGIAVFVLPRLAVVFGQLEIQLPLITRFFLEVSRILSEYGLIILPSIFFGMLLLIYILFIYHRTKFIGQAMLFSFPGFRRLLLDVELAKMGYLLSTLLEAGLPLLDALRAVAHATSLVAYQRFYLQVSARLEVGATFADAFEEYHRVKKLIPPAVQQMIISGEQSGRVEEVFRKVGQIYEAKTDIATKDLTVILEPFLLFVVWIGVVTVALAVILPIYSLIGGLNQ
jgi:type II secretory pathway component PulF